MAKKGPSKIYPYVCSSCLQYATAFVQTHHWYDTWEAAATSLYQEHHTFAFPYLLSTAHVQHANQSQDSTLQSKDSTLGTSQAL